MNSLPTTRYALARGAVRGFTLFEMLVIAVVIVLLMSLAVPTFDSIAPTRKTALSELKSFVDSARVLAQKEKCDVYLAFSDASSEEDASAFRRYALFKARDDRLLPGENLLTRELDQVTPWESLPLGMVFALGEDFEVAPPGRLRTVHDLSKSIYVRSFPFVENDQRVSRNFPFLMFSVGGRVEIPSVTDADALHIGIAEGRFSTDQGRRLVKRSGTDIAQTECLKINHYTGKSRVITD